MKQPERKNPAGIQPIRWRGKLISVTEACLLAARQQTLGNFPAAVELYDAAIVRLPRQPEIHSNRGALLQLMGRHEEALASYDRAIALKPDYANAHYNRAAALKQLGRLEEALAGYDRAIALKPDHVEAHNNRASLLQQLGRYDEALAAYERVIALRPGYAIGHNNLGIALMNQGRMREAEPLFRRAIELQPDLVDPLYNLVQIRRYPQVENDETKRINTLLADPGLAPEKREQLYFAQGKLHDDCGLYDEAFDDYRKANEIRNAAARYDAVGVTRLVDALIRAFPHGLRPPASASMSGGFEPLFLVGMPRAGTTLLASALSNHPAIALAGELPTISELAGKLSALTGEAATYPDAVARMSPSVAQQLARDYETRLCRNVGSTARYIIDKNPLNFQHLGFIAALFPGAKIIHCRRDALDTCLSNYFQRFPLNLAYCFDLKNIAHFYSEYVRLMDHWQKVFGDGLVEVRYEELVTRTAETLQPLVARLGLGWDERCLTPHTNPAPMETASHWQVRQPIYHRSIGRWRHYERFLTPLKQTLPA
ncbi:MAG TPA: sulfotransferase [Verrucomicrobiae bacterium]|nr:sulfotransferase [Verrucomicrobiae bacterium]